MVHTEGRQCVVQEKQLKQQQQQPQQQQRQGAPSVVKVARTAVS